MDVTVTPLTIKRVPGANGESEYTLLLGNEPITRAWMTNATDQEVVRQLFGQLASHRQLSA